MIDRNILLSFTNIFNSITILNNFTKIIFQINKNIIVLNLERIVRSGIRGRLVPPPAALWGHCIIFDIWVQDL